LLTFPRVPLQSLGRAISAHRYLEYLSTDHPKTNLVSVTELLYGMDQTA